MGLSCTPLKCTCANKGGGASSMEQECIPVGCIPSAAVAVSLEVCLSGGCLPRGLSTQGVSAQGDVNPGGWVCLPRGSSARHPLRT